MADENQPQIEGQANGANNAAWEDAFREMADTDAAVPKSEPAPQPAARKSVLKTAPAAPRRAANGSPPSVDIDFLLDISLDVTVEVGRTKMMVNDLLQLQQGSVIDLDKMIGEPFEVYVNKKLIAFGEVVVVNEKFGIRLTDIIDPKERIQQLG